jgi:hypothetical protein
MAAAPAKARPAVERAPAAVRLVPAELAAAVPVPAARKQV